MSHWLWLGRVLNPESCAVAWGMLGADWLKPRILNTPELEWSLMSCS